MVDTKHPLLLTFKQATKHDCTPSVKVDMLVRNLQLLAAVDGVAFKTVEGLDFLVAGPAAQVLLGNAPKGVAIDYVVDTVGYRGAPRRSQVGNPYRGHNGVGAALILIDDRTVSGHFTDIPLLFLDPGGDGLSAVILRPGDGYQVTDLDSAAGLNRLYRRFRLRATQLVLDCRTEGIHVLAVLRPPVQHIPVVGRNAQLVALAVADNVLLSQTIELAEIHAEVYRFMIDLVQIGKPASRRAFPVCGIHAAGAVFLCLHCLSVPRIFPPCPHPQVVSSIFRKLICRLWHE